MSNKFSWPVGRFGSRGARLALLTSGVAFMALIGIWAVIAVIAAWQAGHILRGVFLGLAALLLLLLSLRIMTVNWRATSAPAPRPLLPADGSEQTGIWGVGGPSMREPGSTGDWPLRSVDRRYENRED